jgi:type VI secretion system secreted protein VgrG
LVVAGTTAFFKLHGENLPDDISVFAYQAVEALSELYEVAIEFATEDTSFDVQTLLKGRLLLQVINEKGESRFFDGIVESARFQSAVGFRLQFRITLVPTLALLKYREDSRIFQTQSVPDIIKVLLQESGIAEQAVWELEQTYPPREYTVQYRESSFNFISRLLEDEGISYFFLHTEEGHKIVFLDTPAGFENHEAHFPEQPKVALSLSSRIFQNAEAVSDFSRKRALRTTSALLRDYEFKTPQVKPEVAIPAEDNWPMPYYEYGAGFSLKGDGNRKATARISGLRRDAEIAMGSTSAIGMRCAGVFTVEGGAQAEAGGSLLVMRLESTGRQEAGEGNLNYACRNRFEAGMLGNPIAPERRARRPRIAGLQTAIVTGSETEDQSIHVDEFGRIKVRFYWDRIGQQNDKSSCWIRVNQVPMGGSMVLPRLGWEVSVVFLEGDPDRPLVVGRVYNGENAPPMSLPGAKASGSIKSMSSPKAAGSNELTMGDSGGAQGFAIMAQKDLNMTTNWDCTTDIKVNDEHHVNKNIARSVKVDDSAQIGVDQSIEVGANFNAKIGGSQSVSVGANDTSNATANVIENITGNRDYTVGANQTTISNGVQCDITGNMDRTVGAVDLWVGALGISDDIKGNSMASAGAARIHLVNGNHGEVVGAARTQTYAAAEIHLVKGAYTIECQAMHSTMVGAVCMQKVDGDVIIKAPAISLMGALGTFKGGSSELKLAGGPITMKGSKVSVKGALIKKTGVSLKLG